MKVSNYISIFVLIIGITTQSSAQKKKNERSLVSHKDSVSYCLGMNITQYYGYLKDDIDFDIVSEAIRDFAKEEEFRIPNDKSNELLLKFQEEVKEKTTEMAKSNNLKEAELFLEKNRVQEGVIRLPSGLQFSVLASGKGATPIMGDTVEVNYKGYFLDGNVFDSNKEGMAARFVTGSLIQGMSEALLMMKEGDKWIIVVPPHLGYGEQGYANFIGPNQLLIFELELLHVVRAVAPIAEQQGESPAN